MEGANQFLAEAQALEPRPRRAGRGLSSKYREMLPAVDVMREKKYTWKEIAQFFLERDQHVSQSSLATAYSRFKGKPSKKKG